MRHYKFVNVHGRAVRPVGSGLWVFQVVGTGGRTRTGRWIGDFEKTSKKARAWANRVAAEGVTQIVVVGMTSVDRLVDEEGDKPVD